mmetsp:Transcript_30386/g.67365  ORF Transcript_30386/g.67365 Transcript_30386/m.67365 type:complete len:791 (+) Transcript_30386:199-2571(+)
MSGWKRSRRMVGTMSATQCANSWPLDAADSIRTSTSASRSADEDADPAIGRTRTRAFCSSSSGFLFLVSLAILSVAAFPSAVASGPRVSEMTIEETWSETERMSLRGHHTTAKTTTRTRVPVRVDTRPSSSRGDGGRTITSNRVLTAEAYMYTDTKVGTRRTQDRCTIEIKDKISIDGITETVKVDTTLKNLCLADIKLTMLTMSSCVLCDGQEFADAQCSPAVSVLEEFIAFNNGSDVIEENIEKEISFALELQSFGGGPGVACSSSYFTKFSYEAEPLVIRSEVEQLEKETKKNNDELKFDVFERADDVIYKEESGTGGITGNSNPATKRKRSRRRVCSESSVRNKCLRCQARIRRKFEDGECGNDIAAVREGRDCNKFFDRYRVAVFRRKCRRWRDLYANCFLPQAVSPSPNAPETCETACNIEIKGESTYKNKRLTTGVAIYSDCGGAVSIEELTYAFCSECSQADGTVEKKCDEPPIDILGELEKVNGGTTVLPPDAQRYFEVVSDEFEGNCQAYAKIRYDAFAAFQVFYESFSASVEADCSDDEGGAGPRPIQPSPSLDAAFANYFQDEENCVYADLDGCGGRDVIFAGVDSIKEGECVEVADPTSSDNPTPQGDIDPSRRDLQIKKKKKRRFLKINGVNRKRGRCRRKCASRKKKVSDNIGSNTGDGRRLQQVQCVNPDAKRPNLTRELRKREEEIGFTPTRAAVTQVRELSCAVESRACREGACCGTEGCTCSEVDFTEENCLAGTKKRDAEVIIPCFMSLKGDLDENNECCGASDECYSYC